MRTVEDIVLLIGGAAIMWLLVFTAIVDTPALDSYVATEIYGRAK